MRVFEIIFVGIALFVPQEDGYRVLLPDGKLAAFNKVPIHHASIFVPPSEEETTASWTGWKHTKTAYRIEEPCTLELSVKGQSPVQPADFAHYLPNLKRSDSSFELGANPKYVVEMMVSHGELAAHQFREPNGNPKGMIATRWTMSVPDGERVTLRCGARSLTLPLATKRILLANQPASHSNADKSNHFLLYKLLGSGSRKALEIQDPQIDPPHGAIDIVDDFAPPTDGKAMSTSAAFKSLRHVIMSPIRVCSNASLAKPLHPSDPRVSRRQRKEKQ